MRWQYGEIIVFKMVQGGLFEVAVVGYFKKLSGEHFVVGQDMHGLIHFRSMTEFPVGTKTFLPLTVEGQKMKEGQ